MSKTLADIVSPNITLINVYKIPVFCAHGLYSHDPGLIWRLTQIWTYTGTSFFMFLLAYRWCFKKECKCARSTLKHSGATVTRGQLLFTKFSEENTQIQLPALFFQADTGMAIWRVHKGTQWLYDRYSNWIYEILYFNTTTTEPNTKVIEQVKWDGLLFRRFAVSNHHLRTVTRSQTHMIGKHLHLKCEMLYF